MGGSGNTKTNCFWWFLFFLTNKFHPFLFKDMKWTGASEYSSSCPRWTRLKEGTQLWCATTRHLQSILCHGRPSAGVGEGTHWKRFYLAAAVLKDENSITWCRYTPFKKCAQTTETEEGKENYLNWVLSTSFVSCTLFFFFFCSGGPHVLRRCTLPSKVVLEVQCVAMSDLSCPLPLYCANNYVHV